MIDGNDKSILICDTQAIRGVIIASSLRRRGHKASVADPHHWGTSEAMMYLVAFDIIGRERVRVLRRRFPFTPIISYSEDEGDGSEAIRAGADEHRRPDVLDLTTAIEELEPPMAPPSFAYSLVWERSRKERK